MCGIVGCLSAPDKDETRLRRIAETMAHAVRHRGPDAAGSWADPAAGISVGHRRLAILGVGATGAQPMISASGRHVLVYNGEIYNHMEIRQRLQKRGRAPDWRGTSDTETLLAAIEELGLDEALDAAKGMFAFALWNRALRQLKLIRDRFGEKPLYYGWQGSGRARSFLFGSELAALEAHPDFEARIARNVLPELLRHGHVGEDRSIYENIRKVRPGEIVTVSLDDPSPSRVSYWNGHAIATDRGGEQMTHVDDLGDTVDQLESRLLKAVELQMVSDVPLGAFLSGGIDSSTIVALMQRVSSRPVLTFSIGFSEARYNEAEFARAVSQHIGTDHTDLYVSDRDLLDVVPRLPYIYDEPFADSSQIPTFLVAQLARRDVTVALSGDGGDELFSGYDRYRQAERLLKIARRVPRGLRSGGAAAIRALPIGVLDMLLASFRRPAFGKEPNGQWLHRMADYMRCASTDDLHRKLVSRWRFPEEAVLDVAPAPTLLDDNAPSRGDLCDVERMMQLDMLTYLPDDILTKVDRATMAVSLESRAPFLDPDVARFAWSLPRDLKLRNGTSKWILRQVLYKHVPKELVDRPKMGFEVPIGPWLRGPLRDWADALLAPERLRREGWFDADVVNRHWREHLSGKCNWGMHLWNVLAFQGWLESRGQSVRQNEA